jgi:hypothetical protein
VAEAALEELTAARRLDSTPPAIVRASALVSMHHLKKGFWFGKKVLSQPRSA